MKDYISNAEANQSNDNLKGVFCNVNDYSMNVDPNKPAYHPTSIRDFIEWLHKLATGVEGELVLIAIEQQPQQNKKQVRTRRFSIGDA